MQTKASPDGKQEALIQNFNVYVRPVGGGANATNGTLLSTDGSEGNSYTFQSMQWSPDSKKIVAFRRRPGYERLVHYVESSPTDQLQPKHTTNFYRKPGDVVDLDVPVLFDVATRSKNPATSRSFPTRRQHAPRWRGQLRGDVRYNHAGTSSIALELDATTGKTHAVRGRDKRSSNSARVSHDVADGKGDIWASAATAGITVFYDGATGR